MVKLTRDVLVFRRRILTLLHSSLFVFCSGNQTEERMEGEHLDEEPVPVEQSGSSVSFLHHLLSLSFGHIGVLFSHPV